jgi:hypothetical protein
MEVIREFPHPIQDLSKWHSAPQRGNLIDQFVKAERKKRL